MPYFILRDDFKFEHEKQERASTRESVCTFLSAHSVQCCFAIRRSRAFFETKTKQKEAREVKYIISHDDSCCKSCI